MSVEYGYPESLNNINFIDSIDSEHSWKLDSQTFSNRSLRSFNGRFYKRRVRTRHENASRPIASWLCERRQVCVSPCSLPSGSIE
jgi:hypothetical protein